MASSVPVADQLKTYQALHAKAAATVRGFNDQIQGWKYCSASPECAQTDDQREAT